MRLTTGLLLISLTLGSHIKREAEENDADATEATESTDAPETEAAAEEEATEAVTEEGIGMDDEDDDYDIEDYYEDYGEEGSGGFMDLFMGVGKSILNPIQNMFGGLDDDYDDMEGSAVVDEWWKTWSQNYDDDLYDSDSQALEQVTRYPLPNLNENGHIDMSEFGFRDTLDEYFDIFVIILSASILLLLACAGYGRARNIRYLKKTYGENSGQDEEESGALLTKNSD